MQLKPFKRARRRAGNQRRRGPESEGSGTAASRGSRKSMQTGTLRCWLAPLTNSALSETLWYNLIKPPEGRGSAEGASEGVEAEVGITSRRRRQA